MNNDKIMDWMQILAGAGVIAGLIMVGLQMKQNEEMLRIQIMSDYYNSYVDAEASFTIDHAKAFQKSVENPASLTNADMRLLEGQSFNPLLRWVNLYRLSQAGIVGPGEWKNQVQLDAAFYYGTPWGRAWWDLNKDPMVEDFIPLELRDFIQSQLDENNIYNVTDNFKEMKANAIEYAKKRAAALKNKEGGQN